MRYKVQYDVSYGDEGYVESIELEAVNAEEAVAEAIEIVAENTGYDDIEDFFIIKVTQWLDELDGWIIIPESFYMKLASPSPTEDFSDMNGSEDGSIWANYQ